MKYLSSYRPLVMNGRGKSAICRFGIPPFVDYSCRREPDFESRFTSITALCRGSNFAPRLNESDIVIYMTVKGKYAGFDGSHRRLTAILKVIKRFESHQLAAEWYQDSGLDLPGNCMVRTNAPLGLDETSNPDHYCSARRWDALYWKRSREIGVFLACKPLFLELRSPPVVSEEMLCAAFGRVPGTQNPPAINDLEYRKITELVGTH